MKNALTLHAPTLSLKRSFADLQHPKNKSIMLTDDPEIFRDKSLSQYFKARILQYTESHKRRIEELFRELYPQINSTNDDMYLDLEDDQITAFVPVASIYKSVKSDIDSWIEYYADLSRERFLQASWVKEILFGNEKPHDHDFPSLNINGLSLGTTCENVTVPKCAPFYFETDVKHSVTIPEPGEQKLMALITPAGVV